MMTTTPAPGAHARRPGTRGARPVLVALLSAALAAGTLVAVSAPASAAVPTPEPVVSYRTAPEPASRYQGQVSCDPVERPGTVAVRDLLKRTYGKANAGGITRACSVGGASEHKEGRAYDWALNASNASDKAMADGFIAWLVGKDAQGVTAGNARRLGVQYVIWNRRMWSSWTGAWKEYTGASPHTDHVHISLSWDGAMKRTSFWTGTAVTRVDHGPCQVYVGEPAPRYTGPNYTPCAKAVPRLDGVVAADFDGDGRDDVATFVDGAWTLRLPGRTVRLTFGRDGDVPVAGDWNGDGRAGVGVYRNGTWLLRNTLTTGPVERQFGMGRAGWKPVVGKWDGRRTGVGVVDGNNWHLRYTVSGGAAQLTVPAWGGTTDAAVAGDWDGDGKDSIGVYRAGTWVVASGDRPGVRKTLVFGHTNGRPLPGDWDGDGRTTWGTARVAEHVWTDSPSGTGPRVSALPF